MSNTERRKILNYRNANGLLPNPNNIDYGEIAIGYKKDKEAIYIKNTTNEIVDFTPISIVNLTYNELKNLRDNSKLKPSQYYRITDFVTTVANDPEARSAGHPFDIIVLATDVDTLNENAKVVKHEGDTYFANSNLDAWEIKYDLDNDKSKYAWADETNGKGVIYYMKDEFNNECPYDFKNVQFKRYKLKGKSGLHLADYTSGDWDYGKVINQAFINWQTYLGTSMNSNNVSFYYTRGVYNNSYLVSGAEIYKYNSNYSSYDEGNLVFDKNSGGNYVGVCRKYNYFDIIAEVEDTNGEWFYTFSKKATATDAAVDASLSKLTSVVCYNNSTKEFILNKKYYLNDNIFIVLGTGSIYSNNFNTNCYNNTFGNNCYDNSFGNGCNTNTFGNSCSGNTFGNSCYTNTFGNSCDSNTFGSSCSGNTFGNSCNSNTFGNGCDSNTFATRCYSNTFGNECDSNSFGNECDSNSFGNSCSGNTFGNNCYDNSFGNGCNYNTFGNSCYSNTFGNSCGANIFGNECYSNTFGNSCWENNYGSYFYYNKIKSDINSISFELYTTGSSMPIQYLIIDRVNDNTIIPDGLITLGANYTQVLGLNSAGEVVCKPALD